MNSFYSFTSYRSMIHCITALVSVHRPPKSDCSLVFKLKYVAVFDSSMHASSTVDFIRTDLMNLRILISEYKLWRLSLWNFLCKFFIFSPIPPNTVLSTLLSKTWSLSCRHDMESFWCGFSWRKHYYNTDLNLFKYKPQIVINSFFFASITSMGAFSIWKRF